MKKFALLISLFIYCQMGLAQTATTELAQATRPDAEWTPGESIFGIHLMPLSLTNRRTRLRVGAIWKGHTTSYLLDLEYMSKGLSPTRSLADKFYGIRPEIRHHLKKTRNDRKIHYVGLEVPINYAEKIVEMGTFRMEDGTTFSYDRALQKRLRTTFIIKIGYLYRFHEHWYIDAYTGLGAGLRQVAYYDVENARIEEIDHFGEWFAGLDDLPSGDKDIFEFALGFRIGYNF